MTMVGFFVSLNSLIARAYDVTQSHSSVSHRNHENASAPHYIRINGKNAKKKKRRWLAIEVCMVFFNIFFIHWHHVLVTVLCQPTLHSSKLFDWTDSIKWFRRAKFYDSADTIYQLVVMCQTINTTSVCFVYSSTTQKTKRISLKITQPLCILSHRVFMLHFWSAWSMK